MLWCLGATPATSLDPIAQSVYVLRQLCPALRRAAFSSGGASCYTLLAARLILPGDSYIGPVGGIDVRPSS